jgi:hypothetical protein
MFEGVGLVVPLEMSLKDPSKFRFLFSTIVYVFSAFCMLIGILVRILVWAPPATPTAQSNRAKPPLSCNIHQGYSAFGDSVQGSITNALPSSVAVAVRCLLFFQHSSRPSVSFRFCLLLICSSYARS